MRINLDMVSRTILGLIFLIFGLNGFLNFIPSAPITRIGTDFVMALVNTGYLMTLVKIIEILVGVLLLLNKKVPLALLLITPILLNILLFHFFLSAGLILPIGLSVLLTHQYYIHWSIFKPIFK